MSGGHLSKEFFELVKSIGESRSKQEEDRIIVKEIETLKKSLKSKKKVSAKQMKEYMIRMIYVEMLGHDATFAHIEAVNLAANKSLMEKRVAYLAVSLTLNSEHPFMYLLINSLLTDLKSSNFLECAMSLVTVCKLANAETIPAVQPLVLKALDHKQALVRKKAIMALHKFYLVDKANLANCESRIRAALCDPDPAVMGAALNLFIDLIADSPQQFKDLVPSFVNILKQVTEHRLPKGFNFKNLPAPWIQIKLLRVLALLGHADQRTSQGMYETLQEVMKRADIGLNIGYAIVYECVRTVTHIYPNAELIEDAALSISRFISSDNHNLKYLGVTSLAAIVQIDAKYAAEHQMTVVDCLEDPDETLRRKTVSLLVSMTNPQNVSVITEKLIAFLRNTTDVFLRKELVEKITAIAFKFAPDPQWYIQSINAVIEQAGSIVSPEVSHGVMKLIAESAEDEDAEEDMRIFAVDTYLDLLGKKNIPDILVAIISWTLGEYGHLSDVADRDAVIRELTRLLDRPVDDESTKAWILSGLMKQVAHYPCQGDVFDALPEVKAAVEKYQHSIVVELQQRAHEFTEFVKNTTTMRAALPVEVSEADLDIDAKLSFLDGFVSTAMSNGARPYQTPEQVEAMREQAREANEERKGQKKEVTKPSLNFEAYKRESSAQPVYGNTSSTSAAPVEKYTNNDSGSSGLQLSGVSRTWGVTADPEPEPEPEPAITTMNMEQFTGMDEPEPEPEPVRSRQPQQPVMSERERAAQALFGGVSSSKPKPGSRYGQKKRGNPRLNKRNQRSNQQQATAQPTQPKPKPEPAQPAQPAVLDIFGAMAASSTPAPAPKSDMDFLSAAFGVDGSTPAPTQASSTPAPAVDLFSAMASTPAPTQASSGFDMFGQAAAPVVEQKQVKLGAEAMNPKIKAQITNFAHADENTLIDSSAVQLSTYNVVAPSSTFVMFFISNKQQTDIRNLEVKVQSPQQFRVQHQGDAAQRRTANQLTSFVIPSLAAGSTSTQILMLQCQHISSITIRQLRGQLSWQGQAPQPFALPLSITDLLRPLPIQTKMFGQLWKKLPSEGEVKFGIRTAVTSADFMAKLKSLIHIHNVQTIGQENICAGTLVQQNRNNTNMMVLVHGKIQPGGVVVLVRSAQLQFSQLVAVAVKGVLS